MDISEAKKKCKDFIKENKQRPIILHTAIETVLEELDKKDMIINEMAEMLTEAKFCYFKKEDGGELLGKYRTYTKDEWIEYFTKKVEGK